MRIIIQETATVSSTAVDYTKASAPKQREWTAQNLGIELGEEGQREKRADWEEKHGRFIEFNNVKDLLSNLHS
jgi:hypothetical protein